MPDRTRARQLAAEYLAKAEPTGWFERLYREAEEGKCTVPWADRRPNPNLIEFWRRQPIAACGKRALKIGCGLGDDAEQLSQWGFLTTAFDISETAIRECRSRFPQSPVEYVTANLLQPPVEWSAAFDFVLESYTLQVLPPVLRRTAVACAASFVKPGAHLLLIARGREQHEPEGEMPWPLTRCELDHFKELGLREMAFEDYTDKETPPVRRFRALYQRMSVLL